MDEQRNRTWDAVVEQVVAPLIGLAVMYYVGSHAASIEIELRARWRRLTRAAGAARSGYETGRKVAEWFVQAEAPKVIAHAEDIARSAAGPSSPEPPASPSARGEGTE